MMNGLKPGDLEKMISVARETYSEYGIQGIFKVDKEGSPEYGTVLVLVQDGKSKTSDDLSDMITPRLECLGILDYVTVYTDATEYKDMCKELEVFGGVESLC